MSLRVLGKDRRTCLLLEVLTKLGLSCLVGLHCLHL